MLAVAALVTCSLAVASWVRASPATPSFARYKADPALVRQASTNPARDLRIVIRELHPSSDRAERLVAGLHGSVTRHLGMTGGFAARIPGSSLDTLAGSPEVVLIRSDVTGSRS